MLVGRAGEQDHIAALARERRVVVVTGPAGIGKTTVARTALEGLGTWAEAGALATLAWTPLLVFRRLLGGQHGDDPGTIASAVVRRGLAAVLLDDLQWADAASLDVIGELVGRVAVVAIVRTGEERSKLVIEVLQLLGAERVELAPLSPAESRQLVTGLRPELAPAERASVLSGADGNPLLLSELPAGGDAPANLVSALLSRLDALDRAGRRAAERLAVLGHPAAADLLGPGMAAVVEVGLATEVDGRAVIRHALLAEVIVDLLGGDAHRIRRDLAAEVAPAEAAHLLAAAGDTVAARQIALQAAESAGDKRERAELLELAILCSPPGQVDPDLRVAAADLLLDLSQPERAAALCTPKGMNQLDRKARGALRRAAAQAAWMQGQPERSRDLIEASLADLRGSGSAEEAYALAGSTILDTRVSLDGGPALQRAREAVTLADQVGAHQGFARMRLASVLLTAGGSGWAEHYEAAIEAARRAGDEPARRTALTSLVLAEWVAGDPCKAHALVWEDVVAGPAHEHDDLWLSHHAYAAIIGLLVGIDQQVLVDRHEAVLNEEPVFRNRPFLEAAIGLALADLNRPADARRFSAGAAGRAGQHPQARSVGWWLVAETAWLAGRLDEAIEAGTEAVALAVGDYPSAVHARLVGGHAQRELGGCILAGPEPVALLAAWKAAPLEWVALEASMDGRHDEAALRFEEAGDAWSGHDVRSEARCRWAAADEARLDGADDAVERLLGALELAEARRLSPLVERCRRSLRAAGVTSRARSTLGHTGLTAREEGILRLIGAGSSTSDVAAVLGVKASTVDSLVQSATRKLGAPNRLAAATLVQHLDQRSG